jgi:predicted nucleic acid-binding protein
MLAHAGSGRAILILQYLSVLTLGEIEKGILLLDEGRRRREIKQWFENDLQARFAGRILAIDKSVASTWARFVAPLLKQGRSLPTIDSLLAATALAHDLTYVTRNVKHFRWRPTAVTQSLGSALKRRPVMLLWGWRDAGSGGGWAHSGDSKLSIGEGGEPGHFGASR